LRPMHLACYSKTWAALLLVWHYCLVKTLDFSVLSIPVNALNPSNKLYHRSIR
jgi:hypothetical protein